MAHPQMKKIGRLALRASLSAILPLVLFFWLIGTEPALRWGINKAVQLSAGKLTVTSVHGSIYGPLRIAAISLETDTRRIEIQDASLDWAPRALFQRHLEIKQLRVKTLKIIEIKPNSEPLTLPESLQLPVTFSALGVDIESLIFSAQGTTQQLHAIRFDLEKFAHRYALHLANVTSEWGKIQGQGSLDDTRPFYFAAQLKLDHPDEQVNLPAYQVSAKASGNLTQLQLDVLANALTSEVNINAQLTPFATFPLLNAQIKAQNIDPSRWRKDLPKALINGALSLTRKGGNGLQGQLAIHNTVPGAWDQSRFPLRELAGQLSGTLDQLALTGLRLDLAEGGTLMGDGSFAEQQLQLRLHTKNLNPKGLLSTLQTMRLAGDIQLQADAKSQQIKSSIRYKGFAFFLDAGHQNNLLDLREVSMKSGTGSLTLHGALTLAGERAFQLAGGMRGFNPADFGRYPVAKIDASFSATGQLAAELKNTTAQVSFAIANSHFRRQPLSGQGSLHLSAARLWNSEIALHLASNQIRAQGSLGRTGDQLNFSLTGNQLSAIDPQLSGQAHVKGRLAGRFAALTGEIEADLRNLARGKVYRLDHLSAAGHLAQGKNGLLSLEASLAGLQAPQGRLDQASVQIQGTRLKHSMQLTAKNANLDMETVLAGAWHDTTEWTGQVMHLTNRGPHALTLTAPAKLALAKNRVVLSNAAINFAGAHINVRELAYQQGKITTRGELTGLPVAYLQRLIGQSLDMQTDLILDGDWQLAITNNINGHIAMHRKRGDIFFPGQSRPSLGLSQLALDIKAANNTMQGKLSVNGTQLGSLEAKVQSQLALHKGGWGMANDAPLAGDINLATASIAWVQPLLDSTGAFNVDGSLNASVQLAGTLAKPKLAGTITGKDFNLALPDEGLRFTDGLFHAQLQDQVIRLENLSLRGGSGQLTSQGQLTFASGAPPSLQLAITADKLTVLSRPDRSLILSGTGKLTAAKKGLQLMAKLEADRGLIELPKGDTPTLSRDVVVLNKSTAIKKSTPSYPVKLDLELDVGKQFFIKGKGLDAQLGGALKLTGAGDALPRASGSIHVVKGTYSAYGQQLQVERGILNFQGLIDNPGLNIIAMRKNQAVEAGVSIAGTAQNPRVTLVSTPNVPDGEKLSWLVLGHGIHDASGQEFGALQAAAGALLAAGESVTLQQRIAYATGLEEVNLKGAGGLESTVLTLGKRLSARTYLSYEQAVTGMGSMVKIDYTLTKHLSVRTQAGQVPAVDLFYNFSFD